VLSGTAALGAVGILDDNTTYTSDVDFEFNAGVSDFKLDLSALTNAALVGSGFQALSFVVTVNGAVDSADSVTYLQSDPNRELEADQHFAALSLTFDSQNGYAQVNSVELNLAVTGDGFGLQGTFASDYTAPGTVTTPEPTSWVLLLLGGGLFVFTGRKTGFPTSDAFNGSL
jgi:hypothetical protein